MTTPDAQPAPGHDHGALAEPVNGIRREHGRTLRDDESVWDARYAELDQVWSGNPNLALTVEVEGTAPARALEVGCGEGADAVWLARQGWTVTAVDPSGVALERARAAADAAGADVTWKQGGLHDVDLPEGGFDLVSVFYPALDLDDDPVARLAALVAPGGTLLVVHHAEVDRERALEHGFDPDLLLSPAIVADQLRGVGGWTVVGPEKRPRSVTGGAGAHHHDDLVVHAVRTR